MTSLATFGGPADLEEMLSRRQASLDLGLPYLVAEAGAEILGFAYASAYHRRAAYRFAIEDSVYVADGLGGRGIGAALLGEVIARCERGPWRQMLAIVGDSANAGSIALHRRFGFELAGTLRSVGFKFGQWVDTPILQRNLGGEPACRRRLAVAAGLSGSQPSRLPGAPPRRSAPKEPSRRRARVGRIERRNGAVEEKGVAGSRVHRETGGRRRRKSTGLLGDGEYDRRRVRNPNAVADLHRRAVWLNYWMDLAVDDQHRPGLGGVAGGRRRREIAARLHDPRGAVADPEHTVRLHMEIGYPGPGVGSVQLLAPFDVQPDGHWSSSNIPAFIAKSSSKPFGAQVAGKRGERAIGAAVSPSPEQADIFVVRIEGADGEFCAVEIFRGAGGGRRRDASASETK